MRKNLKKSIAIGLGCAAMISMAPVAAHAEWRMYEKEGWSYLDNNTNQRVTGWAQDDENLYYLDSNGIMENGKDVTIDGKKYTFNMDGTLIDSQKAEVLKNNKVYQIPKRGSNDVQDVDDFEADLWKTVDGKVYHYKDEETNQKTTGWYRENDNWYYFDENGVMQSDKTIDIKGKKFTFDKKGVLQGKEVPNYKECDSHWKLENGNWYYYDEKNQKVTGWLNYNEYWYYLGTDGALQHDKTIVENNMKYVLDSEGVMKTMEKA